MDFVVVSFGLAVSVIEEDRSAVALNRADKHYSPEVTAKALELVDAVGALAMNPTPEVFNRFAAMRDKVRDEPWFSAVRGDFAWVILPLKKEEVAPMMAKFGVSDTPWLYDPMVTISTVEAPQLRVLGQKDMEAPSAETARRLALLRLAGRPISTALFPSAEHGIVEYELSPNGTRQSTRYSEGYFQLLVDFSRGSPLKSEYGTASVSIAHRPSPIAHRPLTLQGRRGPGRWPLQVGSRSPSTAPATWAATLPGAAWHTVALSLIGRPIAVIS